MSKSIVFIDVEAQETRNEGGKIEILSLGALRENGASYNGGEMARFKEVVEGAEFVCGHNILHYDLPILEPRLGEVLPKRKIDTLYLSPLLFPQKESHALGKEDKLRQDQRNDPRRDAEKAKWLLDEEVTAFRALPPARQDIYCGLLYYVEEFRGFFDYLDLRPAPGDLEEKILAEFGGQLCANADVGLLIADQPAELAYTLALICGDGMTVTPPWLRENFPGIDKAARRLRGTPCKEGCPYCKRAFDLRGRLKEFFGYEDFRTYDGVNLQEQAIQAAVDEKSLLAVFPTGGGKSVTFQLPALMAGQAQRGLTVVISPLQSLMKDQVDHMNDSGLVDAVTVNGSQELVDRMDALERVRSGTASILYIAPENLRSRTIEHLLLGRNVVRFVIDEAHCFSAWGQDFRVDYLYIGDFIRMLQEKQGRDKPIPVSCFTATAKKKVVEDICAYFREKLGLEMERFVSTSTRENLHYRVMRMPMDEGEANEEKREEPKRMALRELLNKHDCPAIVYAARIKTCEKLVDFLQGSGIEALPYYGKLDPAEKKANQEAFLKGEARVMVATSAFGMGVDKKDVGLVVHYDISDSLEDYVQEAGRAGRDSSMTAECVILYWEEDLNKHFTLLNQSRLGINEIQQVWRVVKDQTRRGGDVLRRSPMEIARAAGWDDSGREMEDRVTVAVAALENAGYLKRGQNAPRCYGSSIRVRNMEEAAKAIDACGSFQEDQADAAKRIMKSLISKRSIARAGNDLAESRLDYLADMLGLKQETVIDCVNKLRAAGLLADQRDLTAYILKGDSKQHSLNILNQFIRLERFLYNQWSKDPPPTVHFALKEMNQLAADSGIPNTSVRNIRTILHYLAIKGYITKREQRAKQLVWLEPQESWGKLREHLEQRETLCTFILKELFAKAAKAREAGEAGETGETGRMAVEFSLVELHKSYWNQDQQLQIGDQEGFPTLKDVETALLYLSKINAMELEGGFLVLYNKLEITRLVKNNKINYKKEDYKTLTEYYQQKTRKIHIMGEYADLMSDPSRDEAERQEAGQRFLEDYFQMEDKPFVERYFPGKRAWEIERNLTPKKYQEILQDLTPTQRQIMDDRSPCVVVSAGPGSGKTRVLVHKLASLLLQEEVKSEQLLMVTFTRSAATEFKKRLKALVQGAANFVEVRTFHSLAFDLLGKVGTLNNMENVVEEAAQAIEEDRVEAGRIAKTVLVIDEAQDMDAENYHLVRALMDHCTNLRVIAVGDDDQNIYGFRKSNSKYMAALAQEPGAVRYEMGENFRSKKNIVALANAFATRIRKRMKTAPIRAVLPEKVPGSGVYPEAGNGTVKITRHTGRHMEQALADEIARTFHGGSACVLTQKNDEAAQMVCLLNKRGVRAKLSESTRSLKLEDLAEIRFFLKKVDQEGAVSISKEVWEEAVAALKKRYRRSTCLGNCLRLLDDFSKTCGKEIYLNDLRMFIQESKYEDFYEDDKGAVFVSTIHMAKGREYDSVYLLLSGVRSEAKMGPWPEGLEKLDEAEWPEQYRNFNEESRLIYVAITRAKENLYIHCDTDVFGGMEVPDVEWVRDAEDYPEPEEMTLQLSGGDMAVSTFYTPEKKWLEKKRRILNGLCSGDPLWYRERDGILGTWDDQGFLFLTALSVDMKAELKSKREKGYEPVSASVRFVTACKAGDKEYALVLPDIHLKRKRDGR